MRKFRVVEPGREYIVTEERIMELYYPHWCKRMRAIGKESLISSEECLNDWIAVHWAEEVFE